MMTLEPGAAPAFILDLDLCVGCHACVIACANENTLIPGRSWRQIVTFNTSRIPDLPVYHLSIACNHCLDAPCVNGCPAAAITRDGGTGAVLIDGKKCIGCHYCSWVCPYDAPQFNTNTGVMQKCTLCNHRLLAGESPACCSLCPTDALIFGRFNELPSLEVKGFPEIGIRPAMGFRPMRARAPQPPPPGVVLPDATESVLYAVHGSGIDVDPKVSVRNEWPLVAFSYIGICLVAWFLASLMGGASLIPWIVGALGLVGIGLSAMHLGRKGRSWRAMLNWRGSWLSREVIAYALFVGVGFLSSVIVPGTEHFRWIAATAGIAFLFSLDRLYGVMAQDRRLLFDGYAAILAASFLIGVVTGNLWIVIVVGTLRVSAVMERFRRRQRESQQPGIRVVLRLFRLGLGIVIPILIWMLEGEFSAAAIACAALGELLDRLDFYDSISIITPRRTMALALTEH